MVRDWLGLANLTPSDWASLTLVQAWWSHVTNDMTISPRALASIIILVFWTIWNERNARVFRNTSTLPSFIVANLKVEARNWVIAGTRHVGNLMP